MSETPALPASIEATVPFLGWMLPAGQPPSLVIGYIVGQ